MSDVERLVNVLLEKHMTICTAESCTGGLLASMIVDVPGASDVFERGFITYANEAKNALLGVTWDALNTYGAVSPEVAEQMARGAATVGLTGQMAHGAAVAGLMEQIAHGAATVGLTGQMMRGAATAGLTEQMVHGAAVAGETGAFSTGRFSKESVLGVSRPAVGVGITGIAGPGGGTAEKPVGLVYIGCCIEGADSGAELGSAGGQENAGGAELGGAGGKENVGGADLGGAGGLAAVGGKKASVCRTFVKKYQFSGDRRTVRESAAAEAVKFVLECLGK